MPFSRKACSSRSVTSLTSAPGPTMNRYAVIGKGTGEASSRAAFEVTMTPNWSVRTSRTPITFIRAIAPLLGSRTSISVGDMSSSSRKKPSIRNWGPPI